MDILGNTARVRKSLRLIAVGREGHLLMLTCVPLVLVSAKERGGRRGLKRDALKQCSPVRLSVMLECSESVHSFRPALRMWLVGSGDGFLLF